METRFEKMRDDGPTCIIGCCVWDSAHDEADLESAIQIEIDIMEEGLEGGTSWQALRSLQAWLKRWGLKRT